MTEPLEELLTIRVSKTDRALLDTISHQEGDISISGLVRGWVRQEARKRGLTVPVVTEVVAAEYQAGDGQ